MPSLFDPIQLGAIAAPNRILMAPLTRGRATRAHVPTPIMADYYAQRAGAGLIISEATGISRQGLGWAYAPGLWTEEQVEAWKPVVAAVHAGGRPDRRAALAHGPAGPSGLSRRRSAGLLLGDHRAGAGAPTAMSGKISPMPRRARCAHDDIARHPRRLCHAAAQCDRAPGSTGCSSMPPMAI